MAPTKSSRPAGALASSRETKKTRQKYDSQPIISSYDEQIRPMVDLVDKLRKIGASSEGLPVPSIVVIGDQSSGKSTVLEALSGIGLPRGSGIVTRVPLVLRMKHVAVNSGGIKIKYGDIEKTLESEDMVHEAVWEATNFLAGTRKGITHKEIYVTVERSDVHDLTLIDLPGITRVPVDDQPRDIYDQVCNMIRRYIIPEETVILNVISAEVDFSTCESIAMSQAVDPTGDRTLAVVTKIDRCSDGLYEKITSNAVNVGLGYVCVWNCPGSELPYDQVRKKEAKFFSSHPQLSSLPSTMLGIPALATRLAKVQADKITKSLPKMQTKVKALLAQREKECGSLPCGTDEARTVFHRAVMYRRQKMESLLCGNYAGYEEDMQITSKLDRLFETTADTMRIAGSRFLETEYHKKCLKAMEGSRGVSLPNLSSPVVFQELFREEVEKLSPIAENLVNTSIAYAQTVALNVIKETTDGYPKLAKLFSSAVATALEKGRGVCKQFTNRILEKECSCIYTNNHYYMDTVNKIRKGVREASYRKHPEGFFGHNDRSQSHGMIQVNDCEPIPLTNLLSNVDQSAQDLQIYSFSYWKVVMKRVCDVIPMEIKFTLKKSLLGEVDNLVISLASGQIEELMQEEPVMRQKRLQLENSIAVLKESSQLLADFCF